jgi:four helix bundle protein
MKKSILAEKSFDFAKRIVRMYMHISKEKHEYHLTRQCLRSGTSVGAMVSEAAFAQSRPDFVNKLSMAVKEANETSYWLQLLKETDFLDQKSFDSLYADNEELIKILTASILTAKKTGNR